MGSDAFVANARERQPEAHLRVRHCHELDRQDALGGPEDARNLCARWNRFGQYLGKVSLKEAGEYKRQVNFISIYIYIYI